MSECRDISDDKIRYHMAKHNNIFRNIDDFVKVKIDCSMVFTFLLFTSLLCRLSDIY